MALSVCNMMPRLENSGGGGSFGRGRGGGGGGGRGSYGKRECFLHMYACIMCVYLRARLESNSGGEGGGGRGGGGYGASVCM